MVRKQMITCQAAVLISFVSFQKTTYFYRLAFSGNVKNCSIRRKAKIGNEIYI